MRLSLTAIIVLLAASCTADVDRLQVVEDFERLKNAHDTAQTLALFTADAVLDFGPMGAVSGHDAIDRIHEYDVALATQLDFETCVLDGDDVVCRVTETNQWLAIAGIDSITYPETRFAFDDTGKIRSIAALPSQESQAALGAAMSAFGAWAQANAAERFAALFDTQGNFQFSYDNGQTVLRLLREWRRVED